MRWRWVAALAGALVLTALATDAMAQRRDRGDRDREWVLLGEQSVGFRVDRDIIRIGQSEDWYRDRAFRRLHLVAEGNDIHLIAVRLVYFNGFGEDYRVDRLIRPGEDQAIELRGDRSFVRQLELTYRSRPGFGGRAVMKVYGEPSRRGGPPGGPPPIISGPGPRTGRWRRLDGTRLQASLTLWQGPRFHRRWPSRRTVQSDPPSRARGRRRDAGLEGRLCQWPARRHSGPSRHQAGRSHPAIGPQRAGALHPARRDGLSHHPELQGPCAGVRRGPAVSPTPAETIPALTNARGLPDGSPLRICAA